jgi:hypothetical protein
MDKLRIFLLLSYEVVFFVLNQILLQYEAAIPAVVPSAASRASTAAPQTPQKNKRRTTAKQRLKGNGKGKGNTVKERHHRALPAQSSAGSPASSSPGTSALRILPTPVYLKKSSAASVAFSSLNNKEIDFHRALFHPSAFSTSRQSCLISGSQREHSLKRCSLVCRFPDSRHQHSSESLFFNFSLR